MHIIKWLQFALSKNVLLASLSVHLLKDAIRISDTGKKNECSHDDDDDDDYITPLYNVAAVYLTPANNLTLSVEKIVLSSIYTVAYWKDTV